MIDPTAQSCPRYIVIDLFRGGNGFSPGLIEAVVDKHRDEIARETDIPPKNVSETTSSSSTGATQEVRRRD